MKNRFLMAALAMAVIAVASPATANRKTAQCSSEEAVNVSFGSGGGGTGSICSLEIRCPADHKGPCSLKVDALVTGTGLVGVRILIDGEADPYDGCSFTPQTCSAKASASVRAGDIVDVYCPHRDTAAVLTQITCRARIK